MYKGEVNVTQAGLGQLLRCAEQLQIRGLYGSEATINYKQLHQASLDALKDPTASTPRGIKHVDSTETDDAATNSTTSTITTSSAPPYPVNQQHQQQQQQPIVLKRQNQDARQQRPHINGSNALQQQSLKATSAIVLGSHSNAPTEDDSGDEVSNNWNAYGDHFEDNKMNTQLALQQSRFVADLYFLSKGFISYLLFCLMGPP